MRLIEDISIDEVAEFYDWLQGESCPENLHFEHKLNLTGEEAFDVIYFLQEQMRIIPHNYERCRECGRLFDTYKDGINISEETSEEEDLTEELYGFYCDYCSSLIDSEFDLLKGDG